jgi:hypothetical protein
MAKNKVYIDVVVDDKGTTKRVAVNAKKLGLALEETGKSARTADRNLKGVSQQSANGTKNFSKMAQGISGTLVPAYATLAANVFALSAAFNFLENAANFRVLQDAQVAFSSATGKGYITLSNSIQKASDSLIDYKKASQIAAIGSASGLSGKQLQDLTRGATDAALVLGRNVPDSIDRVIRGVTKAEPELLDELGIILRLKDATEEYAAATKQSADDLGSFERSQAVAADVLSQLEKKYSSVTKEVELQSNKISKLKVEFEKVFLPIQSVIGGIGETIAGFLGENVPALTAALTLFALPIITSIIPATQEWTENTREAAKAIKTDIKATGTAITDLSERQKALKDSSKSLRNAVVGQLEGRETKSKGVAALRAGDTPTKGQLRALIREAEKGRGVVSTMSEGMKRDYIKNLKLMLSETTSTTTSIKTKFQSLGLSIQKTGLQIARGWKFAMLQVQRATQVMASTVDKAIKAISIVGILLLIKDALVAVGEAFGFIGQSANVKDMADELNNAEKALKSLAKEFSKFNEIQETYRKKNKEGLGLDYFQAQASFISSSGEALLSAISAQNAFAGLKQEEIDLLNEQKRLEEKIGTIAGDNYQTNALKFRQLSEEEQAAHLKKVELIEVEQAALAKVKKAIDENSNLDANFLQQLIFGYESVEEAIESLSKKIKEQTESFITTLEKQGIQNTTAGAEYIKYLNILKEGGKLQDEDLDRFKQLNEVYGTTSQRLAKITQDRIKLNQTFRDTVNSITQFESKYTRALESFDNTITDIEKSMGGGDVSAEQMSALRKELAAVRKQKEFFVALNALEVNQGLRKLGIEKEVLALNQGATTLEKEQIERAKKKAQIENSRLFINEQLAAAQRGDLEISDERAKQLQLQLGILDEQERALLRQEVVLYRIVDGMEQALESSFEKGVSALIKGAKDFKDVLKDISDSILGSVADNIAKALTEKFFTDKDTPENRIQAAMVDAANYHGAVIKAAITGTSAPGSLSSTTSGVKAKPDTNVEPKGTQQSLGEKLLGRKTTGKVSVEGPDGVYSESSITRRTGGIFSGFINAFSDVFNKNVEGGFIKKLGAVFTEGGNLFGDLFSSLLGSLGGIGGGAGGLLSFFFANGGIAKGGFRSAAYANGGIASQPTLGLVGEGKYNEAIVPLPDGRSIPVTMPGGGAGQNNNVTVNVTMHQDGRTEQQTDGDRGTNLGHMIASAVQKELQNQKRSGGILNPYGTA